MRRRSCHAWTRLAPRKLVALGMLTCGTLSACDREPKEQSPSQASASASAAPKPEKRRLQLSEWVKALDSSKLEGADPSKPESVVMALHRHRAATPSLLESGDDDQPEDEEKDENGDEEKAEPVAADSSTKEKAAVETKEQRHSRADALLEKGFRLRKNPVRQLDAPIDWGANPKPDNNWHYTLNSLRAVRTLVSAYERTKNPRYRGAAKNVVLDWIDYNLIRDKPNEKKWHDMGTGQRSYVLAYVLDQELRSEKPDVDVVRRLVWAAYRHLEFLSDKEHFTRSNHGIFMITGMAWLLKALPEVKHHSKLDEYARSRMRELLQAQFTEDAYHREHSPSYHLFVSATFKRVRDTGLFDGLKEFEDTLARADTHVPELYHPNGNLVSLGDSDRGSAKASEHNAKRAREASEGGYSATDGRQSGPLRVYDKTGYAIFRSGWGKKASPRDDYLFIGAGYHSGGHKHADHLSFEWSFRGQPILVDSGKYTYNRDEWKKFFQSTRAGNAVEVDGKNYTRSSKGAPGSTLESAGELDGLYYVYCRQKHRRLKVDQRRLFVWRPGAFLLVVDRMKSKTLRTYRQWFHFHDALEPKRVGDRLQTRVPKAGMLFVEQLWQPALAEEGEARDVGKEAPIAIEMHHGQTEPRIQGWVSPDYLKKVERTSVGFRQKAKSATFATLFSTAPALAPKVEDDKGTLVVQWRTTTGAREGFRFTPSASDTVSPL